MDIIVLNKHYQYWCEADLKRVVKWLIKNKIEIVESYEDREIRCLHIKMPVVVRLLEFIGYKAKREDIPFTENAVYLRDNNTCQYWHYDEAGKKYKHHCSANDRTIDHVVPKSKGGKNSFENCVCACQACNIKVKKNRAIHEAGLELIRKPVVPRNRKGEFVTVKFVFNPDKPSHRVYLEKVLGEKLEAVAEYQLAAMAH